MISNCKKSLPTVAEEYRILNGIRIRIRISGAIPSMIFKKLGTKKTQNTAHRSNGSKNLSRKDEHTIVR